MLSLSGTLSDKRCRYFESENWPLTTCLFLSLNDTHLFHPWLQSASCDVAECHGWKPPVGRVSLYILSRFNWTSRHKFTTTQEKTKNKLLRPSSVMSNPFALMPASTPPMHQPVYSTRHDSLCFFCPSGASRHSQSVCHLRHPPPSPHTTSGLSSIAWPSFLWVKWAIRISTAGE